jgi:A/G-specific adenine glycosylase
MYIRLAVGFGLIPPSNQAAASIDEVNALWKGLGIFDTPRWYAILIKLRGYYSRASRLLAGAQKSVNEYSGRLPDNAKDMQANIPGIGRYSAGAICSIAYGESVPVVRSRFGSLSFKFHSS